MGFFYSSVNKHYTCPSNWFNIPLIQTAKNPFSYLIPRQPLQFKIKVLQQGFLDFPTCLWLIHLCLKTIFHKLTFSPLYESVGLTNERKWDEQISFPLCFCNFHCYVTPIRMNALVFMFPLHFSVQKKLEVSHLLLNATVCVLCVCMRVVYLHWSHRMCSAWKIAFLQ